MTTHDTNLSNPEPFSVNVEHAKKDNLYRNTAESCMNFINFVVNKMNIES